MKKLKLLNREGRVIKEDDSLTNLLYDYEPQSGDHVVLYNFKERDYFLFLPHLDGVVLLKKDEKIFVNNEFIFKKLGTGNELWRGIIPHSEGVLTIIDKGLAEKELVLFKKGNQRETLAIFIGGYECEEHPALLGSLVKSYGKIFHNGEEKKEWVNSNIHHLVRQLEDDIGKPLCLEFQNKLWVEKTDGTQVVVCNYDRSGKLPKDYRWFLNKGIIVEEDKQIVLYLIEKADYKK